jgi:hypothetical protein
MEKLKPIIITDNETGKQYTLEFDRASVERAENDGFSLQDIQRYPSKLSDLWHYAFYMHHKTDFLRRELTRKKTDEMLDACGGILGINQDVWVRLSELYMETYTTLQDGAEKNARMTIDL